MKPVPVTKGLCMLVLSQQAAEARMPSHSTALLSITGNGWAEFHSVHEPLYSLGILRMVIDDVAAGLDEAELESVRRNVRKAIAITRHLDGMGTGVTMVIHCHAGMSRSTAMAVGCAVSVSPESLDDVVTAIRDEVVADGRRFMPNPLILEEFERALGLPTGRLAGACGRISQEFRTWDAYWKRRAARGIAAVMLCMSSAPAAAQELRSPMIIERGLSARELVPCGRDSKPPPECGMDLNSAGVSDIAALPGMDATLAARIVRGRPYAHTGDIMERGIVTTTTFDLARTYLWVMRASLRSSTSAELTARLGIGKDKADAIVKGRPWYNVDDLAFQGILSMTELERLRPLISLR